MRGRGRATRASSRLPPASSPSSAPSPSTSPACSIPRSRRRCGSAIARATARPSCAFCSNKKDAYLLPALSERYQKDLKLRDLVLRFTGKFEELIESANKADPDNVLTTAFLTADIGKLYLLIQRNLGKVAAQ